MQSQQPLLGGHMGAQQPTMLAPDRGDDAALRHLDSDACSSLSAGMLTAWGWKLEWDTVVP
ncbi:hypothetical protein [Streptomyces poriferorum]|uniref:hypothetical protein n=1 Tax=Streptomyces poriferorum TaxID=2798799 RepID=UPI00353232E1